MDTTQPTILIVEDDAFTQDLYAARFREDQFRVITANDGEEGWAALQREVPDILFTAIDMPKMAGFELIERVGSDPRFAKMVIFILSHHGRATDRERADAIGVDEFIVRGYTPPAEVVLRARAHLVKRQSYQIDVNSATGDAPQLIASFGLAKNLMCRMCGTPLRLLLQRDPLRPKQMFSAYFVCPKNEAHE